jgi:hypothetical protein
VREVRFVYGVPSPGFLDFSLNFKVLFKFGDYVHMTVFDSVVAVTSDGGVGLQARECDFLWRKSPCRGYECRDSKLFGDISLAARAETPSDLENVIAVSCGYRHCIALTQQDTVCCAGDTVRLEFLLSRLN